jgi:hypothetical protein
MKKTNRTAINSLFIYTSLQELLEMASMFTDIKLSCARKIKSQDPEDLLCIVPYDATVPLQHRQ